MSCRRHDKAQFEKGIKLRMTSCCASFKQINPNDWESASKEFVKDNPAKRLGESKEVGRLVAFLLSGEQSAKS